MRKLRQSLILGLAICFFPTFIFAQSRVSSSTGNSSSGETSTKTIQSQEVKINTSRDDNSNFTCLGMYNSTYKPTWQYNNGSKGVQIYSNGPWSNSTGTGAGGADENIMQSSIGITTFGFGFQLSGTTRNRVADDFFVNAASWDIDSMVFFGYQTGSTTSPSTFTAMNIRIWDGVPGAPGSVVVWGDTTTNVLDTSYWSGVYRVEEGFSGGSTRPIMRLVCATLGLSLNQGTYWVDYQAEGSGTSGPWAPPIVVTGQANTGNAVQRASNVWAPLISGEPQGLPFVVFGNANGTFTDDLGITAITAPVSSVSLTNTEFIEVTVTNFATSPQTGFSLSYSIDGQTPVTETYSGTLAGNSSSNFIFSTPEDFSTPGQIYTIEAYTELSGDEYMFNDTAYATVKNLFGVVCSAGAATCDEYIEDFTFANISKLTSGCGLIGGYSDFTNDTAHINIGSSYAITVYNPEPYSADVVGAWFDWNQNGSLTDAGEFYQLTSNDGGENFSGNITVPNWALNGDARMRIRIQWGGTLAPCGISSYGEVEDYTINVGGIGITCDVMTSSIDMNSTMSLSTITPKATFANLGSDPQTFDVTINITGGYTDTKTITALAPGTTHQVTFAPWTNSIGTFDVQVYTTLACDTNFSNDTLLMDIDVISLDNIYLYVAYDPTSGLPEGPGMSSLQIPGSITSLASTTSTEFICGGTWAENTWYAIEYKDGTSGGRLYTIDTVTGVMTAVGPLGQQLNGISYDPINHIMYGVSSTSLYTINMTTGAATLVGSGGIANSIFIGLACNNLGELYTYSIDDSKLYSLNTSTGAATLIGALGFTASYAQDMEFDMNTGILYLAAYNGGNNSGELRTCNTTTGATTLIGAFQNKAEVCGFAIPHSPMSSIKEHSNVNFNMFPNPANDIVYINSNEPISSVRVLNTLSQIVFETSINGLNTSINTSNLRPGLYIIQVETSKGTNSKRLIINK